MAKHKYIETPEKLLSYWNEYKKHVKENPDKVPTLTNKGNVIDLPVERPLQLQDFESYLEDAMKRDGYEYPLKTFRHYRENKNGAYDEYCQVVTRIENEWYSDQVGGAMNGKYKAASLIGRVHNIAENQNLNIKGEVSPFNPIDINVPSNDSPNQNTTA